MDANVEQDMTDSLTHPVVVRSPGGSICIETGVTYDSTVCLSTSLKGVGNSAHARNRREREREDQRIRDFLSFVIVRTTQQKETKR